MSAKGGGPVKTLTNGWKVYAGTNGYAVADEDGDIQFIIPSTVPFPALQAVVDLYLKGYREGRDAGKLDLQFDLQKLLGVRS